MFPHGWSLYDLSLDCLGELFARDSLGALHKFDSFLRNLDHPPAQLSDLSLFLALKAYINRFISYRLAKLLGEADPEGRRISRNIRETIRRKKSPIQIAQDVKGEILLAKGALAALKLPEFPLDILEQQLRSDIRGVPNVNDIVRALGRVLSGQTSYQRSVRLVDVIQVVKRIYGELFFQERNGDGDIKIGPVNDGDQYFLRRAAIRFAAQKIDATYFRKKKISEKEALGFLMTVTSILDEWLSGAHHDPDYFIHARKELRCTEEEYADRWAARIHYLVKSTRSFIADHME